MHIVANRQGFQLPKTTGYCIMKWPMIEILRMMLHIVRGPKENLKTRILHTLVFLGPSR